MSTVIDTNDNESLEESTWERRLDDWLGIGLFVFAMLVFGLNVLRALQSSDTGWLAKTGEYMVMNHRLPAGDIFSWTCPQRGWTVYQWLYMLVSGYLLHEGGLWLVGLSAAVVAAIVFVWLLPSQMLKQNVRLPYVFGLLALVATPAWFWARPQLISFILLPVFLNILERFRTRGYSRVLWTLPPLMVLWVNGHSFWFIGLLVMASYLIPAILKAGDLSTKRNLSLIFAACLGAVLVNPYGLHIVAYNATFLTEPDFNAIVELQPTLITDWQSNQQAVLYFVISWFVLILRRKHIPKTGFFLALCGTVAAFRFFRFVPVGILLTWPFVAIALSHISATSRCPNALMRFFKSPALPAFAVVFSVLAYNYWYPVDKPTWFTHSYSNANAIAMLKLHPELTRNMLTDAAVGCSQIVEGLTPVFVDTRFDFYGKQFCDEWLACMRAQGDWQAYMKKWKIRSVCIADNLKLYDALKKSPDWLLIFDDNLVSLWVPDDASGRRLFEAARLSPGCEELQAMDAQLRARVVENLSEKSVISGKALLARGEPGKALEQFQQASRWTPTSAVASRYVRQLSGGLPQ